MITRIGTIGDACGVLAIVGIFCLTLVIAFLPMWMREISDDEEMAKKVWKIVKVFGVVWVIAVVGSTFVPSTKEMLAIYGIGGTIDYVKSNDKAKELPDKVIDALDRYIDTLNDNEKE